MECTYWRMVHLSKNNNMRPSDFFDLLCKDVPLKDLQEYTFIIGGIGGPTGKTWLCGRLNDIGCKAIELSNTALYSFAYFKYTDDKNHYIINHMDKLVTIVLNKPLPKEVYSCSGRYPLGVEPKKMTVSEINKALGYPVEIVAEGAKEE